MLKDFPTKSNRIAWWWVDNSQSRDIIHNGGMNILPIVLHKGSIIHQIR